MLVRLILDPPCHGAWNMAVDEALLTACSDAPTTTLRIYGWSAPTLSLGYFQAHDQRQAHQGSVACPLVRRATGGGAIVHDQEMTYSFITPVRDRNGAEVQSWYDVLHGSLVAALAEFGVNASLCPATDRRREGRFLCFERRSAGDILLQRRKIAGSAQRRQRRAVLQHGSLLVRQSPCAPELPGICDVNGDADLDQDQFARCWLETMSGRLSWQFCRDHLTTREIDQAQQIEKEKFQHAGWTLRR
jgi:lipoate-protein ligase A